MQPQAWMSAGQPAAVLRPYIASIIDYRYDGPAAVHRGLPSPHLTVVVTLDEPLVVLAHPDPAQRPGSFDSLVGGLHRTPALIEQPPRQAGVQLALTPLGCRALFGLPAAALAGIDVPAADLVGSRAADLREQLQAATDAEARRALLQERLLAWLDRDAALPEVAAAAWGTVRAHAGALDVASLARTTGWSSRHLGARLRAEVGLAPQALVRVARFDRARRELADRAARGLPAGLGELALRCGYYDQAHLTREFRAHAGVPPIRWLAEEFRSVQVTPAAGAVECDHDEHRDDGGPPAPPRSGPPCAPATRAPSSVSSSPHWALRRPRSTARARRSTTPSCPGRPAAG